MKRLGGTCCASILSFTLLFAAEPPADEKTKPSETPGAQAKADAIPAPPDVAAPPEGALKTPSGLAYRVLAAGTGTAKPVPTDMVTVNYTGWTTEGKMLDSSIQRKRPLTIQLKRLIPGWIEALQEMVAGEKRLLWIPPELAFQGNPTAPKGMVVYEVDLISFEPGPETPPPDVAAPPADAKTEESGLVTKRLRTGNGDRHPSGASHVTVNYTGWTTDGKMFDSSVARGKPANFGVGQVIAGWTEGLQLMVEGEKRRFWIPEKLAYKGQPGKPAGMLVFDVELLAIQN